MANLSLFKCISLLIPFCAFVFITVNFCECQIPDLPDTGCKDDEIYDLTALQCVKKGKEHTTFEQSLGSNYSFSSSANESYGWEQWKRTKIIHYGSNCSTGQDWNTTTNQCEDVNECLLEPSVCNPLTVCKNTADSFICEPVKCNPGFKLSANGDCEKYDCPSGFVFSPAWEKCYDIDECHLKSDNCSFKCLNIEGSFRCLCPDGQVLKSDNRTCEADPCSLNPCEDFQNCINKNGSFECVDTTDAPDPLDTQPCGYGMREDEHGICANINECVETPSVCDQICVDKIPGYKCKCREGYNLAADNKTCNDIDECTLQVCSQICNNTIGSFTCSCGIGYTLADDNSTCIDIDECRSPSLNNCTELSVCVNQDGSYDCTCKSGFKKSDDGLSCVDIDECKEGTNACQHICVNTNGSFHCECYKGFRMDNSIIPASCKDIDECRLNARDFTPPLVCENTPGSYKLSCFPGYVLNKSTNYCEDIDECSAPKNPCGGSGKCVNEDGSYDCECSHGYQFSHLLKKCEDINECKIKEYKDKCGDRQCINDPGYYHCLCPPGGYLLMADNVTCEDIDECIFDEPCGEICINTVGSFECKCKPGMELLPDERNCQDIDECLQKPCAPPGICVNTEGSFTCGCPKGFTQNSDNRTCDDINECDKNLTCSHMCINTWGSFICLCPAGYKLKANKHECIDVDECVSSNTCDPINEICSNKVGGYSCIPKCPLGYRASNTTGECEDIDECKEGLSKCGGKDDICENIVGGYYCKSRAKCKNGTYVTEEEGGDAFNQSKSQQEESGSKFANGTGITKCPNDHALLNNGSCIKLCEIGFGLDENMNCVKIRCPPGFYYAPNNTCIRSKCPFSEVPTSNKTCKPIKCKPGYIVDHDGGCVPIQCKPGLEVNEEGECQRKQCPHGQFLSFDGDCVEVMPCPDGFELKADGRCIELTSTQLPDKTTTESTDCPEGFIMQPDGSCEAESTITKKPRPDEGHHKRCPDGTERQPDGSCPDICPPGQVKKNGTCVQSCALGFKSTPEGDCVRYTCYPGYVYNDSVGRCVDIDECLQPNECTKVELCQNHEGHYECILCSAKGCQKRPICKDGFEFDPSNERYCKDVDECITNAHNCQAHEECVNYVGSYRCRERGQCPPGFERDRTGKCLDIDECRLRRHNCRSDEECMNIAGSYRCVRREKCKAGFEIDSSGKCNDIDECGLYKGICQFECINTHGSYRCVCPSGYKVLPDGKSCEDINECLLNPMMCEGFCENTIGSFECKCENGFEPKESGRCGDVNECLEDNPCDEDEICINTYSSYKCLKIKCPAGFVKKDGKCSRKKPIGPLPPCDQRYGCTTDVELPRPSCPDKFPTNFELPANDPFYSLWRLYYEQKRCDALDKLIDELVKSRNIKFDRLKDNLNKSLST